ncbi:NEDD4 family-interacting protein 1-like [Pseudomyrmex gracilis]|uniref:NEDD4 family-interacting protein 1-like n=1 Tax=Pseudomyrmex gracilis TaxID=219809 RepID=UPI000995DD0F|nr:NEDD4 family-interacting protein 1-like [Pseudomyrmex gracilis]
MPPQTSGETTSGESTNSEPSNQNEIPTVTVAMPFIHVGIHGHSSTNTGLYATTTNQMIEGEELPPPKPDFTAPPPYEIATKLPSYEEVQREKTLQGEPQPQVHMSGNIRSPQQPLTILAIDTEAAEGDPESGLLGTDFMFFTAFLVAFLFNWIGFLLLMCFCHTIASRYGALAGFGLSLTKWTLIVKHSTDLASRENSWLWWLIMAFGVLICVRSIIQYLNIKRGWRLLSGSAQERLLFFY